MTTRRIESCEMRLSPSLVIDNPPADLKRGRLAVDAVGMDDNKRQLDESSPHEVAVELRRLLKIGERLGVVKDGKVMPTSPLLRK